MCAGSVDGIVQTGIFFIRNGGKVATGSDKGRIGVAGAQLGSLTDKVASGASIFGNEISGAAQSVLNTADTGILAIADKMGCADAAKNLAAEAGTKSIFGAVAQKAVNPLLIGAAGIRILKDDDQYAALIEEGSAMGLMFGAEKLMKTQRKALYSLADGSEAALKEAANSGGMQKILSAAAKKFKGLSKGQKTAAKVGLEVLFVAGSILAYSVGKKIGKALSHREDNRKMPFKNILKNVPKNAL